MSKNNDEPIICSQNGDIGCGFYLINGELFIYIGEYEDLIRNGSGVWLSADTSNNGYYMFTGNWSDDAPNGEGKSVSVRDESSIEKQEGYTYCLISTTSGVFINGLVDGSINKYWIMDSGGCNHNWNLIADSGHYQVIGSTARSDAVVSFCTECTASLNSSSVDGVNGFIE